MDAYGNNRRRHRRFGLEGTVRLYSPSTMWNARLIDLSLRGALLERPDGFDGTVGTRYRLDVRLDGGVMIAMGATLARADAARLGFNCEKIDLDSFAHLKRLVELNLGNADILNRELCDLG